MSDDLKERWERLLTWLERQSEGWSREADCKVEWRDVPGACRFDFSRL